MSLIKFGTVLGKRTLKSCPALLPSNVNGVEAK
jgi:hypothetical protein